MRRTLALLYIGVLISCASSQKQDRRMSDARPETDYDRFDGRGRYKRNSLCLNWQIPCKPNKNSPDNNCCKTQACVCNLLWRDCLCTHTVSRTNIVIHNYICLCICLLASCFYV
ncbi:uncharacterized protein LOC128250515 [Octopus bimaculoides]|uniref:uncharacterized protein LOC128250515 n=1 Tax=Octopus bimaculoides TaxID=37653 RepID=UPI0022E35304|nr:uncharacterized protein LOC128250515 [Octopus bimaculoides]